MLYMQRKMWNASLEHFHLVRPSCMGCLQSIKCSIGDRGSELREIRGIGLIRGNEARGERARCICCWNCLAFFSQKLKTTPDTKEESFMNERFKASGNSLVKIKWKTDEHRT